LQDADIAIRNRKIRILQWGNLRGMNGPLARQAWNPRKFNKEKAPAFDFINQAPGPSWHKEGLHFKTSKLRAKTQRIYRIIVRDLQDKARSSCKTTRRALRRGQKMASTREASRPKLA
jgi:hypothetical protein